MAKFNETQYLVDHAYDFIKQKIMSNEYKQGESINISSITQYLNISRTPVNFALKKLESEGMVTIIPKLGVQVKTMSLSDIKNTYETRAALEIYAMVKAIDLLSNSDIDNLYGCIEAQKEILRKNELEQYWEEDKNFHIYILNKIGNSMINNTLSNIYEKSFFMGIVLPNCKFTSNSIEEHKKILECLVNKDVPGLMKNLEQHIMAGYYSTIKVRD